MIKIKHKWLYYILLIAIIIGHYFITIFLGMKFNDFFEKNTILLEYLNDVVLLLLLFLFALFCSRFLLNEETVNIDDKQISLEKKPQEEQKTKRRNSFQKIRYFFIGDSKINLESGLLISAIAFFVVMIFFALSLQSFANLFLNKFTFFENNKNLYSDALLKLFDNNFIAVCFLIALIGPISEEITFRGFFLSIHLGKTQSIITMTLSSLIFSIMHFDVSRIFYLFFIGFALSLIFYYTQNLLYSIIVHILNNLIPALFLFITKSGKILQQLQYSESENYDISKTLVENRSISTFFTLLFLTIIAGYIAYKLFTNFADLCENKRKKNSINGL